MYFRRETYLTQDHLTNRTAAVTKEKGHKKHILIEQNLWEKYIEVTPLKVVEIRMNFEWYCENYDLAGAP